MKTISVLDKGSERKHRKQQQMREKRDEEWDKMQWKWLAVFLLLLTVMVVCVLEYWFPRAIPRDSFSCFHKYSIFCTNHTSLPRPSHCMSNYNHVQFRRATLKQKKLSLTGPGFFFYCTFRKYYIKLGWKKSLNKYVSPWNNPLIVLNWSSFVILRGENNLSGFK